LRYEGCEFEASVEYIVRPCLKKKNIYIYIHIYIVWKKVLWKDCGLYSI
jgi:hypothetical protein